MRYYATLLYVLWAHRGQKYSNTKNYAWYHLRGVAKAVAPGAKVAALLHDLLEDTKYPLPWYVTGDERYAVQVLTRDPTEFYREYIARVQRGGGLARLVKVADLRFNLANQPSDSQRDRYKKALIALLPQAPR